MSASSAHCTPSLLFILAPARLSHSTLYWLDLWLVVLVVILHEARVGRGITLPGAGEEAARGLWSAWSDGASSLHPRTPLACNAISQQSNNHTGYQFKADNVILSYSSTSRVTTAAEQLASGLTAFVSVDGQIGEADRASFPSETTEVPVAGGALLVVYNLPGNPSLVTCALQPPFVSF
jgi:ABC-type phosphate transport system substrate-binding protein